MKGDYHRYLAEFKSGSERKEAAENTLNAYKSAQVGAVRTFPKQAPSPSPPSKNQTTVSREHFNGRNGTFLDYKRRIPSCPDPLHN